MTITIVFGEAEIGKAIAGERKSIESNALIESAGNIDSALRIDGDTKTLIAAGAAFVLCPDEIAKRIVLGEKDIGIAGAG